LTLLLNAAAKAGSAMWGCLTQHQTPSTRRLFRLEEKVMWSEWPWHRTMLRHCAWKPLEMKNIAKSQADKLIGLQIKLDSILLSCPSCQCVAAIALDREGKSAAYFLPSRPT
jgi:hypothetical protein